jgi:hypothetical protein
MCIAATTFSSGAFGLTSSELDISRGSVHRQLSCLLISTCRSDANNVFFRRKVAINAGILEKCVFYTQHATWFLYTSSKGLLISHLEKCMQRSIVAYALWHAQFDMVLGSVGALPSIARELGANLHCGFACITALLGGLK